jgi:hypothetical protein
VEGARALRIPFCPEVNYKQPYPPPPPPHDNIALGWTSGTTMNIVRLTIQMLI